MVRVLKLNCRAGNIEAITQVATVLRADGVVCLPTDTCYGLSCLASSDTATEKLRRIKARDAAKPFILIVSDAATALSYSQVWTRESMLIADAFWPGPISIVVPFRQSESNPIAHSRSTIAIRVPNSDMLREIMRTAVSPLWSTSADVSSSAPPATIDKIPANILASLDLVIDVGELPRPSPSTVIDLSTNEMIILREGPIKAEDIASVTAKACTGYDAYS